MSRLEDLAARHWRQQLAAHPEAATLFGVHDHDDQLPDPSADAEAARRAELTALLGEVAAVEAAGDREPVVHAALRNDVEGSLAQLGGASGDGVPTRLLDCNQMTGPHQTWLRTIAQLTYPEPEHAAMVVERYRSAADHLDAAADRFGEALARGLTPVRRNVERLLASVEGYLAGPLVDDPLVAVGGPDDWDGEPAWRDELRVVVRDHVRPAFATFADRVRAEQLPEGRDDEHAGLAHVDPDGEVYATLARVHTSLELDAEEVHHVGIEHIEGQLAREWAELGQATHGESDPTILMKVLRNDPSLRYESAEAMEEHAREAVARAKQVAPDWFGRLPQADCVVRPVPEYLAESAAPAYYMQPAPDGSRPGTYFVNSHGATSMLRSEGEATAFHEAIPGHHFQLAISGELDAVPVFMRHGVQTAYAEGWGLYAERLAEEMGLYSSDRDRIGMLTLDAFRAARLVVDTGLHAFGWPRQRAIEWMTAHTPLPIDTIASEVDRYIAMPGQALAYTIGQREILRLRGEAERRLGDGFDIAGFHDEVLGHGMLPLPVLAEVIDRWVGSQL